jgi:Flp pilus assembly protein CpaB
VRSAKDLALVPGAREFVKLGAFSTTTAITHHALLTPMFAGEVVRQRDVLDSRLVHQIGANSVAVPVRVTTSAAALVQRGDHVDVLAGNPSGSAGDSAAFGVGAVATDVVILIPSVTTSSPSMLGASTGSAGSDVVVIAKPSQAAAIAAASVQSTLVLALRGSES